MKQVARTGTDIDRELAEVFGKAGNGDYRVGQEGKLSTAAAAGSHTNPVTAPDPPKHGTPTQNAAWWATLSKDEHWAMLRDAPGKIGELDGIPAGWRSEANMHRVKKIKDRLASQRAEMVASGAPSDHVKEVDNKINAIKDMQGKVANSEKAPDMERYYLLGLSGSGNGKYILAHGNPDMATNVASYVPGKDSNLGSYGHENAKSEAMYHRANFRNPGSTATITWQGYDAPQSLGQAMSDSDAEYGKANFSSFEKGLQATHKPGGFHNTVVGHSYGSTLVGHTARDADYPVDDTIFAGSPGVGTQDVRGLHLDPHHVHSTLAKNDIINLGQSHGMDPTAPGFGGQTFHSDPGTSGPWYQGGYSTDAHGEYWARDNPALDHMAKIIAGK